MKIWSLVYTIYRTRPIYQTQYTKLNQIFSSGTKPNLRNQIYWTKFPKPYLQNQIYKGKFWNVKNQIYWVKCTKPNIFNQTCKFYLSNQSTKLILEKPNLQKIELKSNPSLYWAWPSLFDLSVTALWYMVQGENV